MDYDLEKQEIKSKGKNAEGTVAISGDLAGAMHGKHIKFITTDTGAGVKHHGTILSESDIQIKTEQGDIEIQNLHANKKLSLQVKCESSCKRACTCK
ncbi:protein PfhB2 [Actinobacillus equuli]|nr:protein PfhB2 [Actinobacillus equuli]